MFAVKLSKIGDNEATIVCLRENRVNERFVAKTLRKVHNFYSKTINWIEFLSFICIWADDPVDSYTSQYAYIITN